MENNSAFESFELQLTNESKDFLREAGKWANFLGILGFVGLGLIVIVAFGVMAMGNAFSSAMGAASPMGGLGGALVGVIYLLMALLYFFPVLYLYRFGSRVKKAFANNDSAMLTSSFESLKSHYKFVGILAIIMLSFYALAFIIAIVGGLAAASM
ncbi:hypothetical protein FUA48_14445 [Flavobacterium alkalisoli]|uniref:DUF5362 domain-containing protein n=1 Tax=Flavobacterium alkalisoli TaxID=2602769 RepID=A0A5B9G0B3_9FLAO|nr:DUF5362 family protein [Flavobacterium alkalisoli]QEE50732.1 hypothetical protein FUA48_14445 [Flavobacterium alkalisoli]